MIIWSILSLLWEPWWILNLKLTIKNSLPVSWVGVLSRQKQSGILLRRAWWHQAVIVLSQGNILQVGWRKNAARIGSFVKQTSIFYFCQNKQNIPGLRLSLRPRVAVATEGEGISAPTMSTKFVNLTLFVNVENYISR